VSIPPPASGPPPGWYPDPDTPGQQRYWDGQAWTDHRAPGSVPPLATGKPIYKRWWFITALVALFIGVVGSLAGEPPEPDIVGAAGTTDSTEAGVTPATSTSTSTTTTTTTTAPRVTTTAGPQFTRSQENAIRSAESYLEFTAFSRSGLIGQLEFDGFTNEQAVYGVDKAGL
jgi:hypothetical protein